VTGRDPGSAAAEVRERLAARLKPSSGYFFDLAGRVDRQARASRALNVAILAALFGVSVLLKIALGSAVEASLILVTVPIAFVGGILALLVSGETWMCVARTEIERPLAIVTIGGLVTSTLLCSSRSTGWTARRRVRP
jgi:heavy metal efflux system protein